MGPFWSLSIGGVIQLSFQRLTDQPNGIGNLLQACNTELHLAMAPAADAGHVLGDAPGVVQFREGPIEAEAQPLGLGNDVDDVGLSLVGDGELEDLLAHVGIQRPYRERLPTPAHGVHIPALQQPEAVVELQRTRAEAALGVVAGDEPPTLAARAPAVSPKVNACIQVTAWPPR